MRKLRTLLVLSGVLLSGSISAQTQPPEPSPRWHQTRISLGFNTYNGDSSSLSFSSRFDSTAVRDRLESMVNLDADFSKSGGRTFVDRESLDWALRNKLVDHPHTFALVHTWFEHNQTAGINFRGMVGPGLGSHVIDKESTRLTLEGGVAVTREEQTEDATFPTLFFDPTLRWNITREVSLQNYAEVRLNLKDTHDARLYSETNFNMQITQRVGVQLGATIDFDSQPVRRHKKTTIQTYTMLSFTLGQGRR